MFHIFNLADNSKVSIFSGTLGRVWAQATPVISRDPHIKKKRIDTNNSMSSMFLSSLLIIVICCCYGNSWYFSLFVCLLIGYCIVKL